MSTENLPATKPETEVVAGFGTATAFDLMQRQARLLASSALVPKEFQNNIPNCVIALEMANRIGASPLAVLQNLYIVHGRPSWSSQFIIAAINSSGKYSPLRFDITGTGDRKTCIAWVVEKETGARLESPPVSIGMAKEEGWYNKNGSKWKTMEDLMLRYRAATFFGRLYAPEILMGMQTAEEMADIIDITPVQSKQASSLSERFAEPAIGIPITDECPMTDEEKAYIEQQEAAEFALEAEREPGCDDQ